VISFFQTSVSSLALLVIVFLHSSKKSLKEVIDKVKGLGLNFRDED